MDNIYTATFLNPINNASENIVVHINTTDELKSEYEMNTDELIEQAAKKEINYQIKEKYYRVILECAQSNNCIYCDSEQYDHLNDSIKDVIISSNKPRIILSVGFVDAFESLLNNYSFNKFEIDSDTSSPILQYGMMKFADGDIIKEVNIDIYVYAPWIERNCLIFDEDNPKNCKLVVGIEK